MPPTARPIPSRPTVPSRRQMLRTFANGFGMLGLAGLLSRTTSLRRRPRRPRARRRRAAANPLAVAPPMYAASAKRVIFLFMSGGPSHVDLFDPKPQLADDDGKPLPFEKPKLERTKTGNLLASPWKFAKHGQCGHRGQRAVPARRRLRRRPVRHPLDGRRQHQPQRRLPADEHRRAGVLAGRAWARGCSTAWAARTRTCPASSSSARPSRPRGAALEQQLPAGRLPGDARPRPEEPDRQPDQPAGHAATGSGEQLDALQQLNELHQQRPRGGQPRSTPASQSFELAFRMQREAPEAFDIDGEIAGDAQALRRRRRPRPTSSASSACMARRLALLSSLKRICDRQQPKERSELARRRIAHDRLETPLHVGRQ